MITSERMAGASSGERWRVEAGGGGRRWSVSRLGWRELQQDGHRKGARAPEANDLERLAEHS